MKAQYVILSHAKALAHREGRRLGADFVNALDAFIERKILSACAAHNGGKKTLDLGLAVFVGLTQKK